jgi:hypothetical protein
MGCCFVSKYCNYEPSRLYGLGKSQAVQELRGVVKRLKPQIVFLNETRLSDAGVKHLRLRLGMRNSIPVKGRDSRGGLALLWIEDINIDLRTYSHHHIDVVLNQDSGVF